MGKRYPSWEVPTWLLRAGARAGDAARELTGWHVPLDSERLHDLIGGLEFSAAKIRRDLGYQPLFTLEEELPRISYEPAGWFTQKCRLKRWPAILMGGVGPTWRRARALRGKTPRPRIAGFFDCLSDDENSLFRKVFPCSFLKILCSSRYGNSSITPVEPGAFQSVAVLGVAGPIGKIPVLCDLTGNWPEVPGWVPRVEASGAESN